ncbi:hypothetical protein ACHWQZ_G015625 [Mnemiopsis leidyi]
MEKVKVGAVGDWLVGKTSLLIAYTENNFPTDHIPRVYDQSEKEIKVTVDGEEVALELWDTVACEDYDRLRALLFYPGTDVFLLCYSVCSEETLKNIHSRWAPEIRHHDPDVPILLVGLKADLREETETQSKLKFVSRDEAEAVQKLIGAVCLAECSALTQDGLKSLFDEAIRAALKKRRENSNKSKCNVL